MKSNSTNDTPLTLPALNLPPHPLGLRQTPAGVQIYDPMRRKWLMITPEEHVRQAFTAWLINDLGYPGGLMANEVSLKLNNTARRCDTVLFDRMRRPRMIIEYKAPTVTITERVFNQIARYNMVLRADWLIVSNGLTHYCCRVDYTANTLHFTGAIPTYNDLAIDGRS